MFKVVCNTDQEFDQAWLNLLDQDPVHPIDDFKNLERRSQSDRLVYIMTVDGTPAAAIQVALTRELPSSAVLLWKNNIETEPFEYAIFYSVFRLATAPSHVRLGGDLIFAAANDIKNKIETIKRFVTLSPIPALSKNVEATADREKVWEFVVTRQDPVAKFHTRNGASPLQVWPEADPTPNRQAESYGWMASYEYLLPSSVFESQESTAQTGLHSQVAVA